MSETNESTKYSAILQKQPSPENCSLLASWPGIGNVSLVVAKYLREKLKSSKLFFLFFNIALLCHFSPSSPPPLIFTTTKIPPLSKKGIIELQKPGVIEIPKPP